MNEILRRARAGDSRAESELFKHLSVRFFRFAGRKVGREEALDIAQNACVVIHKKYLTEEFRVSFEAWCHGVFKMVLLKHISEKKKSVEVSLPFEFEAPDTNQELSEPFLRRMIGDCLKKLHSNNHRYFEIIRLHILGKPIEEIADSLGMPRNQLDVNLLRARRNLKKCLSEKGAFS